MGAAFLFALAFHDRGLVATEEGMILAEAESILAGKVLYRDIDCFVAPGVWYVTALVLSVAGHSLNATRLLMAGLFAATLGLIWVIASDVASRRAALGACAVMLLLKVLAFPLGNFIWYTEFAIFFGLVTLAALLAHERRGGAARLVAAGVATALALHFKQNLGGAVFLASLGFLLVFHRTRFQIAVFLAPIAVMGASTLLYFAAQGALFDLLRALLYVPVTTVPVAMGVSYLGAFAPRSFSGLEAFSYSPILFWEERFLEPGWGTGWVPLARAISVGVYALPPVLVAIVTWRALRHGARERIDLLLLGMALAIFASAFPRADFAHVAQAMPGFVLLGVRLIQRSERRRFLLAIALPSLAVTAVFCAVVVLHLPHRFLLEHPRARVFVSEPASQAIRANLALLESALPRDEPVAIIPASPIYYFLTARPVPYRFTVMLPPNVGGDRGEQVVRLLEERDIRYVVLGTNELPGMTPFETYASMLHRYLQDHYTRVASRRFRGLPTLQVLVRDAARDGLR